MLIRRVLLVLGALAMTAPMMVAGSAEAAVPKKAITCGMVVRESIQLYLARDLYCPAFAVRVEQDQEGPGPIPKVTVDLRGHTLRGDGTGRGITAFGYPGQAEVTVKDGVLKNWDIAVGGDTNTQIKGVALIGNKRSFFCNGSCTADLAIFKDNKIGLNVGAEAYARVSRSTFVGNDIGGQVGWIWTLEVDSSLFLQNKTGILANTSRPIVRNTAFVKNGTAIRVDVESPESNDFACADLANVRFAGNKKNLVGPRCAT